jgi:hypothetical protein
MKGVCRLSHSCSHCDIEIFPKIPTAISLIGSLALRYCPTLFIKPKSGLETVRFFLFNFRPRPPTVST